MAYAGHTCEALLRNYRSVYVALEARIAQKRLGKTTNQSMSKMIEIGRRLSAPGFAGFFFLFADIGTEVQRPYALLCETTDVEPVVLHKAAATLFDTVAKA